ncbi:uncharacterized protein N7482_009968 [Penicillium canariense]|uniref:Uncharacterized protein n=1 Tax=Penicillium canariense TaxID=189055 RepID=A0A9W9HRW1_9EURO|nr:uncharacterized protein N7482_009968 [Penicillium canariense]KAJ5153490.1 hypothetical protein N7482_009968 [Penicillium canariense]
MWVGWLAPARNAGSSEDDSLRPIEYLSEMGQAVAIIQSALFRTAVSFAILQLLHSARFSVTSPPVCPLIVSHPTIPSVQLQPVSTGFTSSPAGAHSASPCSATLQRGPLSTTQSPSKHDGPPADRPNWTSSCNVSPVWYPIMPLTLWALLHSGASTASIAQTGSADAITASPQHWLSMVPTRLAEHCTLRLCTRHAG